MKRSILLSVLICSSFFLRAQTRQITLDECRAAARKNYPLALQKDLLKVSQEKMLKNTNTAYLPQIEMNGQATYQSDVPSIPIKLPNMELPPLDKDRYQLTLDVRENIYDGGAVSSQKQLIQINTQIEGQKADVEVFKIEEKIAQAYFTVLILNANEKQLQLLKNELAEKNKKVNSGIKNGVLLKSNSYVLEAEILKIDQKILENKLNKQAAIQSINLLSGLALDTNYTFISPENRLQFSNNFDTRPEFQLYMLMQKNALLQQSNIDVKTRPKFTAFGQAGYAKPGLNLFSNEFKPFYIVGARASWNISAFYTVKREKEIQKINRDIIENQKAAFTKNMESALVQQQAEIEKLENTIKLDDELIELRKKITLSADAQLENGTITSTDFLTERNQQFLAELSREIHLLQLELAKTNYLILTGK